MEGEDKGDELFVADAGPEFTVEEVAGRFGQG
jgi:hypothetical protein